MKKISAVHLGFTFAITVAIAYTACALAYILLPDLTLSFFNALFHAADFKALNLAPMTFGIFLYGLIGITVVSFIDGFLFGVVYNRLIPFFSNRASQ